MSGHHKFNQLIENISPERKARIAQKNARIQQEMALNELQQAFLQKQTDIYINHLREVIALMGGELIIKAKFPDREVTINSFSELLSDKSSDRT
ncbi:MULTISPECIES: hypothetical protein [Planktothricoides]|uniref:Transcriptional regulator n=2 Tax=Planktothricoides raciborskii TaxID=132608 RepID=A0AAU8JDK7_9CYAN|nr:MULTISPECIES: hypothetical protein [Planktothricoides]KOR35851.1 hypothetical protein AM228_16030 [Planktothricoides sp. SR001]MBD2544260.1 transcriptional regulator [Planktothricoides raciborskii FACHB-1370]MBD2583612.1 transcriptional regulator [Planktothricoides raciborskii FACHB-1261]